MLNKLQSKYINAITCPKLYIPESKLDYHWFQEPRTENCLGIPTSDVTEPELALLQTLFEYFKPIPSSMNRSLQAEKWYQYLFHTGPIPNNETEPIRICHFSYSGEKANLLELEAALEGFFSTNYIMVWINTYYGLIIENHPQLSDGDYNSISSTIESEFFIKPVFYVGKQRPQTNDFLAHFQSETNLFERGKKLLPIERALTFEKVFPHLIINQLSNELRDHLQRELLLTFKEDPELLITIKTYLEANFNLSLTAKNLYIHRNTLQYRLDKFVEKTGINLKSFTGALTVYLACILHD